MYDSILVPVDGSEPSAAAVDHACGIAAGETTIHLLHVVEHPERGMVGGDIPESLLEQLRTDGERIVEAATETVRDAGIDVESAVVEGMVTREIADYADANDIDLLVMGTHGRSGVERYLLGSTTERTIRTVDRPVLTVESSP
ncbi:universal stress protein [Haloplanus sp. C73]|uniref:universal stress protein n=1 Tax=Haloplanus sp. C73 TaxID=3421641 RepID=UPI003EBD04FC